MGAEGLSSLVRCRAKGCVLREGHAGQHHGPMRSGHLSGPEPEGVEAMNQDNRLAGGRRDWPLGVPDGNLLDSARAKLRAYLGQQNDV